MISFRKLSSFSLRWGPLLLWCGIIFYGSHQPVPPAMSESQTFQGIDLIYHTILYGPVGFLFFRATGSWPAAILFSLFYGFSDEIHQSFLAYRSFEWTDILMDTVGGGIGATFLMQVHRIKYFIFSK